MRVKRRLTAAACVGIAAGVVKLWCASPWLRATVNAVGWGVFAWRHRRSLGFGYQLVDLALDLLLEPCVRMEFRDFPRELIEGGRVARRDALAELAFQQRFDARMAPIRTDPRPDARPGPPGESEADALVRNVIEACEDGECAVCATALTPQTLVMLDCCVPRRVHGAVGHALCRRCWDRVPDLLEPKRCPHCRRVAKACAPAEMVSRIQRAV